MRHGRGGVHPPAQAPAPRDRKPLYRETAEDRIWYWLYLPVARLVERVTGLVTVLLVNLFGFNIYAAGFNLLSFWGLALTYMYFQIPLMVLIMAPAIDGLKREWREASANLGASAWQYWRFVALPVLWPPLLGAALLLFANAFGAVATAYALTGSSLDIVTILLFAQIRGDVLHNQNLGYALALGMITITALSNAGYIVLRGRSERWLR